VAAKTCAGNLPAVRRLDAGPLPARETAWAIHLALCDLPREARPRTNERTETEEEEGVGLLMDFTLTVQDLLATVKASIADRRVTLEEVGQILTKAANVLVAAASFLGNSGEEKKRLVMAALTQALDLITPALPMSVRVFLMVPGVKSAILAVISGVVEAVYAKLKESK
jgi:hypothetical protein